MCLVNTQRHGYCTLGEALNRLDFSSAIQDMRRFNYVAKVSDDACSCFETVVRLVQATLALTVSLCLSPKAFPANSQVPAVLFERSCPEKLFQYTGEDSTKG